MILADTSVWIDYFRHNDAAMMSKLEDGAILMHPLVLGEIAVGNIANRQAVLTRLANLPRAMTARDFSVMHLIEGHQLFGLGLSYIDIHLLASARLTLEAVLWTRDKRLDAVADRLGVRSDLT